MGYTNIQTKLIPAEFSTYADSAAPDTRHIISNAQNASIVELVKRAWALIQGQVRERFEWIVFIKLDSATLAAVAKKQLWYSSGSGDWFDVGFGSDYSCTVEGGGQLAVEVCTQSFDMSTLTYNTKPGLASVYTIPPTYLSDGHHVSVYPMNWDSQGHETPESLRQVLVNGLALAFIDQSPQPSDASLTQYGVSKLISPYRTNIRVHIADIQLETENRTPATNAYVAPNAPMVVSWSVKDFTEYFTQKPVQASFEVQYYTQTGGSISDWKTITGTTDATATIPASDLAGVERVTWRVRLTSDDGVVGEWSDWEYCTCVNKSGKATALSPDGASVTAGETVMFLWEHSSTSGLGQAAVQIQMQAPGATAYTDIYTGNTSARRRGIVLPSTISNTAGQAAWRVRTKDTAGAWSEWSDPLYIYIVAAAAAPAVSSVSTGTARPVVAWQSANQTGYQVRVRDAAGNTVYDSGVLPGAEQSHQITDYLPDGDYIVAVTIWNQYAIESAEGTKTFTVSAPTLAAAQIRCGGIRGGVRVRIDTKPSARLLLLRDGAAVLEISASESTVYDWGAGAGTHEYRLRAETAGSFSESASSWAAPEIRCGLLSTADDPGRQVRMKISRDASPGHDDDLLLEVTQRAFQGRPLPVAEFTGRRTHTHRHTFSLLHPEDLKLLLDMVLSEKTLLYRDQYGRRYFCICPSLPISYDKYSNDISLDLEEVDYKEDLT